VNFTQKATWRLAGFKDAGPLREEKKCQRKKEKAKQTAKIKINAPAVAVVN